MFEVHSKSMFFFKSHFGILHSKGFNSEITIQDVGDRNKLKVIDKPRRCCYVLLIL